MLCGIPRPAAVAPDRCVGVALLVCHAEGRQGTPFREALGRSLAEGPGAYLRASTFLFFFSSASFSSAEGSIGFSETTSNGSSTETSAWSFTLTVCLPSVLTGVCKEDPLALDGEARGHELLVEVGRGHRAEHLAAFAGCHGEREAGLLELPRELLRPVELVRLALAPALLERLDLLAVGMGHRDRHAAGEEKIARVSRADLDLVSFAAEAFDGLD